MQHSLPSQPLPSIASVKRVHGKAILTLSSGESISMPRSMLKERPYRSGTPFDPASHARFMKERAFAFALEKSISLLAARARTEAEIVQALRANAYPETAIALVMAKLQDAGYIDDQSFAQQWASSRAAKGLGSMRIRMELRRKGLDTETIDSVVSSMDQDTLSEGALMAAQKAARGKNLSLPEDRKKVLAALARRGYSYSVAKEALSQLINEYE